MRLEHAGISLSLIPRGFGNEMRSTLGPLTTARIKVVQIADPRRSVLLTNKVTDRLQEIKEPGIVQEATFVLQTTSIPHIRLDAVLRGTAQVVSEIRYHNQIGRQLHPCLFEKKIILVQAPPGNARIDCLDRSVDPTLEPGLESLEKDLVGLNTPTKHKGIAKSKNADDSWRLLCCMNCIAKPVIIYFHRHIERTKSFKVSDQFVAIMFRGLVPGDIVHVWAC